MIPDLEPHPPMLSCFSTQCSSSVAPLCLASTQYATRLPSLSLHRTPVTGAKAHEPTTRAQKVGLALLVVDNALRLQRSSPPSPAIFENDDELGASTACEWSAAHLNFRRNH